MPVLSGEIVVQRVVVHPLVLLSVVDHFNRMKNVGNARRVVGLLLGSLHHTTGELDISNSFAGRSLVVHPYILFMLPPGFQCLSTKMRRTSQCGSSIMSTWRTCTPCSRK